MENGVRDLSPEIIILLSDYYGVSADYILGRENATSPIVDEFPKELKILMRDAKDLTPDQTKLIHKIVKEFLERHKNDNEEE